MSNCCALGLRVDTVNIKPSANVVDFKHQTVGHINIDSKIKMKCCISDDAQIKLIDEIKNSLAKNLYQTMSFIAAEEDKQSIARDKKNNANPNTQAGKATIAKAEAFIKDSKSAVDGKIASCEKIQDLGHDTICSQFICDADGAPKQKKALAVGLVGIPSYEDIQVKYFSESDKLVKDWAKIVPTRSSP